MQVHVTLHGHGVVHYLDLLVGADAQTQEPLYEHIKPGSPIEELLALNEALMSCTKALKPLNQPLLDACSKAFQACDKRQVREDKIPDKAMILLNQVHVPDQPRLFP